MLYHRKIVPKKMIKNKKTMNHRVKWKKVKVIITGRQYLYKDHQNGLVIH